MSLPPPPLRTAHGQEGVLSTRARDPAKAVAAVAPALELQPAVEHRLERHAPAVVADRALVALDLHRHRFFDVGAASPDPEFT